MIDGFSVSSWTNRSRCVARSVTNSTEIGKPPVANLELCVSSNVVKTIP